ncbi:MAG: DUF721 domain-containing protein [Bacteroidales bacterium]|nr:DUF721 domain-containing protein [Bacteroidales bacterium]
MTHNFKKRETTRHISEIIKEMLNGYKLNNKFMSVKVIAAYKKVVGDYIYKNTEEAYVYENKLYLKIASSIIKAELSANEHLIIKSINEEVGDTCIQKIIFY